jgi:hypothetical protein
VVVESRECRGVEMYLLFLLVLLWQQQLSSNLAISVLGQNKRQVRFGDGCARVFLDLGCNVGVQVRKFFEEELFDKNKSSLMRVFDSTFGTDRQHQRENCVFSFEPNPKHTARLQKMESVFQSRGYRYVHFPFAVSSENATVTLLREKDNTYDADAKLIKNKADLKHKRLKAAVDRAGATVNASVLDFVEFLRVHILERELPRSLTPAEGRVVVKMDIEGEEYNLLPHLISSGVLCQSTDLLLLEWHVRNSKWFLKGALPSPIEKERVIHFQKSLQLLLTLSHPVCKTDMKKLDDESYSRPPPPTWK